MQSQYIFRIAWRTRHHRIYLFKKSVTRIFSESTLYTLEMNALAEDLLMDIKVVDSDSNMTRTHNHSVDKRAFNCLAKLA